MKSLVSLTLFFAFLSLATFSSADVITLPNPLCPGNNPGATGCISSFPDLITVITDYVFTLIAGLAVVMFLWAGILFVTSAGNEGKLTTARKAFTWAVIGIAIAIAGKGLVALITAVVGNPP